MGDNTMAAAPDQLLTVYPLSAGWLAALRASYGRDFHVTSVSSLRNLGGFALLKALRGIKCEHLLIPLEDENSLALLPILKLLAAVSAAKSIILIKPNHQREMLSRWHIIGDGVRFGLASLACGLAALQAWRELRRLRSQARVVPLASKHESQGTSVLYLKTNLWFGIKAGGSVGHIAGVVNGLQNLGHKVHFASAEPPIMVSEEVALIAIDPPQTYGLPYELNHYRFQGRFQAELQRKTKLSDYGLIYQRLSAANYLGAVLAAQYRLPLVVEYNGSEVWIARHWGRPLQFDKLAELAEEVMLKHAHLVVTISEVLKEELIARGVPVHRIVLYPNCIDPNHFNPQRYSEDDRQALRQKYQIDPKAMLIGFLGTFGQWHGAEMLAQTIAELWQEEREWLAKHKVHFLLVGDGLRMGEVKRILAEAGANDIVTLTGLVAQAEAPLYLAATDILTAPHVPNQDGTRFFGSPTKLFEYMGMGKAIVAANLEQIGEILTPCLVADNLPTAAPIDSDPSLAVLFTPGDKPAFKQALKFMVERENWRIHCGKNAATIAHTRYSWQNHVEAIMTGLKSALK